jgi:hypothetical protein
MVDNCKNAPQPQTKGHKKKLHNKSNAIGNSIPETTTIGK